MRRGAGLGDCVFPCLVEVRLLDEQVACGLGQVVLQVGPTIWRHHRRAGNLVADEALRRRDDCLDVLDAARVSVLGRIRIDDRRRRRPIVHQRGRSCPRHSVVLELVVIEVQAGASGRLGFVDAVEAESSDAAAAVEVAVERVGLALHRGAGADQSVEHVPLGDADGCLARAAVLVVVQVGDQVFGQRCHVVVEQSQVTLVDRFHRRRAHGIHVYAGDQQVVGAAANESGGHELALDGADVAQVAHAVGAARPAADGVVVHKERHAIRPPSLELAGEVADVFREMVEEEKLVGQCWPADLDAPGVQPARAKLGGAVRQDLVTAQSRHLLASLCFGVVDVGLLLEHRRSRGINEHKVVFH